MLTSISPSKYQTILFLFTLTWHFNSECNRRVCTAGDYFAGWISHREVLLHTDINQKPTHARRKSKYFRSSRKFVSSGQIRGCSNRLKDRHSGAQRNRKLKHLPSDFVKVYYRYMHDGRDDIVHRKLICFIRRSIQRTLKETVMKGKKVKIDSMYAIQSMK